MKRLSTTLAIAAVSALAAGCAMAADVIVLNDDGAWNWLQDERVVVAGHRLVAASVAMGCKDPTRAGAIEVVSRDLRDGTTARFTLHQESTAAQRERWRDDHSCPALLVRPDGRILALYARHGQDENFHYRVTTAPGDISAWSEERTFASPAGSRVTFPNLVFLAAENDGRGRLHAFYRGIGNRLMPSWAHSDDAGETWTAGGVLLQLPVRVTPYVKYAGDGRGTVHAAFTDGHRVDFNNGAYHAYYRDGYWWNSRGERIGSPAEPIAAKERTTEIFRANADSVAMISDLALDREGRPHVVYSVQMDTRRQRPRPIGADHRYRFARWTGSEWRDHEIAYAGGEVHAVADDDCTGLAALDPQDVSVVYISTNADPVTGVPLVSRADRKRHWEIFRGVTADGGATWAWTAITRDSTVDNLRPVVPVTAGRPSPVVWLRGEMRMPKDFELELVMVADAAK